MSRGAATVGFWLALLGCGVGCGRGNTVQPGLSNTAAERSREPTILEQEPSSLDQGITECSPSGDPRPEYFAPLVSFVKAHMLGEQLHLGKAVLFAPSPSRPGLRSRDVTLGKPPPADEMWVGIDPRSVDGKLVLVADTWTGFYCIHVDERSSPPELKIDMVGAAVF